MPLTDWMGYPSRSSREPNTSDPWGLAAISQRIVSALDGGAFPSAWEFCPGRGEDFDAEKAHDELVAALAEAGYPLDGAC